MVNTELRCSRIMNLTPIMYKTPPKSTETKEQETRGTKDVFLRPADFCKLLLDSYINILKMVVSTKLSTCEECQQMSVTILYFGPHTEACVGLLGCPVQGRELDYTSKRLFSGTENARWHFCPFWKTLISAINTEKFDSLQFGTFSFSAEFLSKAVAAFNITYVWPEKIVMAQTQHCTLNLPSAPCAEDPSPAGSPEGGLPGGQGVLYG